MAIILRRLLAALALSLCALGAPAEGFSTRGSEMSGMTRLQPEQVIAFAKKVERSMAQQGARVALVARMGRPASEMPEGMRYTHVGFAVYSVITTSDGRKLPGYAMYNLYQQNARPDVSELIQDFPVDFFAGATELEAGILVPSPQLQQRLLEVIGSPAYAGLHDPRYSVIANPYTLGRQNCTEFVLDVIESALAQTTDVAVIKERLRERFQAQRVHVSPFKLLFGSMTSAEVSISDQPSGAATATFETIARYLQHADGGARVLTVLHDD